MSRLALLTCVAVLTFPALLHAESSLADKLNNPKPSQSWEIDANISGHHVKMRFPDDLKKIKQLPEKVGATVRQYISYRDFNVKAMRRYSSSAEAMSKEHNFSQQVEYERTLAEVVISLAPEDFTATDPLYRHKLLLSKFPSYTKIHLFYPEPFTQSMLASKIIEQLKGRITLHPVPLWEKFENGIHLGHATTRWAQDLFEVVKGSNGQTWILSPPTRYQIHDLRRADNDYLKALESSDGISVMKIPLFFRGGNILVGKSSRKTLFIGERELKNNESDYYNTLFTTPPRDEIVELIQKLSGTDNVVVLKNSPALFHIDMMMSFIGDGKVALLSPIDMENLRAEEKRIISEAKRELKKLNYKIVSIPTMSKWIYSFKSPVNIIPFLNKETGKLSAFVPKFESVAVKHDGKISEINEMIAIAFVNAGIEPIQIEDTFHEANGSFHCAVAVLK